MLPSWVEEARRHERVVAVAEALRGAHAARAVVRCGSVYGSAQALLAEALRPGLPGPLVLVPIGIEEADDLALDLAAFGLDPERILRFPAWEALPEQDRRAGEEETPSPSSRPRPRAGEEETPSPYPSRPRALPNFTIFSERLETLRRLARGEVSPGAVIVAPIGAVLQPVPEPDDVRKASIPLVRGEELPPAMLEQALTRAGFHRATMVELPGEWSQRGGVLDIYPLDGGAPIRLDYWGDVIDSIRELDPESQRSLRELERVELALVGVKSIFVGADGLLRSLLDYLPAASTLAVLEPARVEGMAIELARRFGPRGAYLPALAWLEGQARFPRLELSALPFAEGLSLDTRSVERASAGKIDAIVEGIRALRGDGARVTILAPKAAEGKRLGELLLEKGLPLDERLEVAEGHVAKGFHAPLLSRALLTSTELFHQALSRRAAPRASKKRQGRPIASFLELSPGDFVVHIVHGIGRFIGVESMENDGRTQEYLKLEYAEGTTVYVPVTKIELVQRYVGARGFTPHLSKIGTAGWQRHKERVKAAVMDLAAELIEVQAARDLRQGHGYPEDDDWQRAFEASFPYEDTPDQESATEAIKKDMQAQRPMDRLVCGDVGYGKTELAMRAAFKAAISGKQVAILVPTTILAEQHLETFSTRMAEFPVKVACLDRFRTGPEAKKIVKAAKVGEVDILIGTHRLLSNDVVWKDLGLVVIDEEQRFGVAHKERLKRFRKTVDMLTLTATPIPRTLHMSLLGIKDISALETPPEGRLAVETVILREEPQQVREAILRELAREGQVYFLHNRVHSIDARARELEALVPEARFAVVHGQMDEDLLEQRMMAFVHGFVDVLVTTTIIESGVDIPRANTIFIDRADAFGLADLHQLRGRVGRTKHRAYAYLLLPRSEAVSEIAERRLKAIEEFNELGAGFRIAMRDLEIRGAGNILGAEQSGHIATVGYDLYCRLLKEAVEELKRLGPGASAKDVAGKAAIAALAGTKAGEAALLEHKEATGEDLAAEAAEREARKGRAPPPGYSEFKAQKLKKLANGFVANDLGDDSIEIELNVDAHIPDRYIPDAKQKIEAYRKLAAARSDDELFDVLSEMRDRFGAPPEAVRTLARWSRLRIACHELSVYRVSTEGKVGVLKYSGDGNELKRRLAYSRTKALWPEPMTCFAVVAEEAGIPPEAFLERLTHALCLEREEALALDSAETRKRRGASGAIPASRAAAAAARAAEKADYVSSDAFQKGARGARGAGDPGPGDGPEDAADPRGERSPRPAPKPEKPARPAPFVRVKGKPTSRVEAKEPRPSAGGDGGVSPPRQDPRSGRKPRA